MTATRRETAGGSSRAGWRLAVGALTQHVTSRRLLAGHSFLVGGGMPLPRWAAMSHGKHAASRQSKESAIVLTLSCSGFHERFDCGSCD